MLGFISNLWKKRKVNRTQSAVLGDCDEMLMCLPSDTAAWVVAKFNKLTGTIQAKDAEIAISRRRVLALSGVLDQITEMVRPYVTDTPIARKVFTVANEVLKV